MRLAVYVTPRAGKDEISGWRGHELALRVTVPPEGGKANEAVCRLLAEGLGVPKTTVRIVGGGASRHKMVQIAADEAQVRAVLGSPPEALF